MELTEHARKLKIAFLASGLMLCIAVFPEMPYGFHILLRWAVCGATIYGVMLFKDEPRLKKHIFPLVILALLFNPLMLVQLTRLIWLILYLGTAVYFLSLSKKI